MCFQFILLQLNAFVHIKGFPDMNDFNIDLFTLVQALTEKYDGDE